MAIKQLTLPVEGMTCASCVAHVERGLRGVQGVAEVNVNLTTEKATVALGDEKVTLVELVQAVRSTG